MNSNLRTSNHPINPLILNRISARKFGTESISENQMLTILEAGRYAPSAQNNQPWHFAYVLKEDILWSEFFLLLAQGNHSWCSYATALVVAISSDKIIYNGEIKNQPTHSLDIGLAIQNILLQTSALNLVGHPMAGFDKNNTKELLQLADNWHPQCMIAFGSKSTEIEEITNRKPLSEITTRGIPKLKPLLTKLF
jgi:nitroreductase